MNKNTKLALYALGAIVGVVGITRIVGKKESDEEIDNALNSENGKATTDSANDPSISFEDKKKLLQSVIGFTGKDVDGIIGSMTQNKLKELGLSTSVTTSNIDSLIEQARKAMSSKQAQIDAESQKQIAQATNKARLSKANTLLTAFNKQGASKTATWIDKDAGLQVFKKDVFGNFIAQPSTFINLKKNGNIKFLKAEITSNGFLRLNLATNMWLVVSPYSLTIF